MIRLASLTGGRGKGDDRPRSLLLHVSAGEVTTGEHAFEVDVDRLLPRALAQFVDCAAGPYPRVCHDHIDAPECPGSSSKQFTHVVEARYIGLNRNRTRAQRSNA